MALNFDLNSLHTNQREVVKELLIMGASVRMLDPYDELLEVTYGEKKEFLLDRFTGAQAFNAVKITADKHLTKKLLNENSISCPEGYVFCVGSTPTSQLLSWAQPLYPLVLKPNWGSHADSVVSNIQTPEQLQNILENLTLTHFGAAFLIEKYYPGPEHRIFITNRGDCAVINRYPSYIVADGVNCIAQLIETENAARIEKKRVSNTALCPIVIDPEVQRYLCQQGLSLHSVPTQGSEIILRAQSNLAKGGVAIDKTQEAHDFYINIAKKCLASFPGLCVAGIDLITPDISKPGPYVVLEVNSSPGLSMHLFPNEGAPQPVAKYMVKAMFANFFTPEPVGSKSC